MDPHRRMLALIAAFVGLLAFHLWLLYRMLTVGNTPLAALLVVAIGLFAWRIAHYANRYRGAVGAMASGEPRGERQQIRIMAPVLAGLLVLHAWLITVTLAAQEYAFTVLLGLAVAIFVARLAFYAKRYATLKKGA